MSGDSKWIWSQRGLRLIRLVSHWGHSYLAGSLPNRCLLCHQSLNDQPLKHQSLSAAATGFCHVCLPTGLYHSPICLGCGKSMQLKLEYCGECQKHQPRKVIAPCSYHQGFGPWIAAIKYQGQFAALPILCHALVERLYMLEQQGLIRLPQAIVPVPLHANRLRQRGFNQAWLIAQELSQRLQLPLVDQGLMRRQDTRPQAGLNGVQRRQNLQDAFELTTDFTYQRIALVDDVVTTGTTVAEIAHLFEARYVHVQIWCLARAEAPGLLAD